MTTCKKKNGYRNKIDKEAEILANQTWKNYKTLK
jgi:hypothetical protein